MITFVVIGKNEGHRLGNCFKSIEKSVKACSIRQYEIIYIDSKSKDNSLTIAKSFSNVRIYSITGECNAAIARNIGAEEAKGDILFFIDGDMELMPTFLSHVFDENMELQYDFVTGHLDDYLYTYSDEFLGVQTRTYKDKIPEGVQKPSHCGGIFIIDRNIWLKASGMKTKYRICEDLDFALRLKKMNTEVVRLPYLIAKHHTVDYKNETRMWENLKGGDVLYSSLLFRDHILSLHSWKRLFRTKYTAVLLFCIFISSVISYFILTISIGLYLITVLLRSIHHLFKNKWISNKFLYLFNLFTNQLLLDLLFLIGLFSFFPSTKKISFRKY